MQLVFSDHYVIRLSRLRDFCDFSPSVWWLDA